MKTSSQAERILIIGTNILLFLAIVEHSVLLEFAAWLLWLAMLYFEIQRDRKNKGRLLIYSIIMIFITCYLTMPFWPEWMK